MGTHGHKRRSNRHCRLERQAGRERSKCLKRIWYYFHHLGDELNWNPNLSITHYIHVTSLHMYPLNLKFKKNKSDTIFDVWLLTAFKPFPTPHDVWHHTWSWLASKPGRKTTPAAAPNHNKNQSLLPLFTVVSLGI